MDQYAIARVSPVNKFKHAIKIMRITPFLMFFCTFIAQAGPGFSQNVEFTFNLKSASIKHICEEIENRSDFRFIFGGNTGKMISKRVDLKVNARHIEHILDHILSGTKLTYRILDNQIAIYRDDAKSISARIEKQLPELAAQQQKREITGRVTDGKGEPITGASVLETGTSNGTMTDPNGRFTLNVEPNAVLRISFLGYVTQDIRTEGRTFVEVVLVADIQALDDVVVIAYGTASRRAVSNALASVSAKDIADKPVANALQAVQGIMPGVNIQQGTGAPGDAPQIKVRGMGSIGAGNSPLYVVDGVPLTDAASFNQINPSDIQSIDVLKDAASAAMYGSRAGNGVVLVTTKRGKAGDAKFQINTFYGMQEVSKKVEVLTKDQYIDYVKDAFKNADRPIPEILNNPGSLANTDWQDEIFEKAPTANLELNVSGGSEKVNYFVSGYMLKQEGILKGTGFDRAGLRTNLNLNLRPWLKMGVNLAPSYSVTDVKPADGTVNSANFNSVKIGGSPSMGSPIALAILTPPIMPVYLPNGVDYASPYNWPSRDLNLNGILAFNGQHYNPVQILDLYRDKYKQFRGVGNAFLQVEPVKNLILKTNIGIDAFFGERAWTRPATLANDADPYANITNPNQTILQNALVKGNGYSWVWENTANYKTTLNGVHNIDAVIGYSAQKTQSESIAITSKAGTATNTVVNYPTNGTQVDGTRPSYGDNALISSFGRVQYNYDYRYMLSAAIRRDGSSRFGTSNRFATFPSVSAAWSVSEEDFFKGSSIKNTINDLKLRASWGKTGNFNIGDFTRFGTMNAANYPFGNNIITPGFGQAGFNLDSLTWEVNQQFDLGLDLALFNNRIVFTADYYDRLTKALLLDANIPALTGVGATVKKNVGSVSNKGIEFGLNTRNLVGVFKWNTNFNISFNKNRIVSLVTDKPIIVPLIGSPGYNANIRYVAGGSVGDFYGMKQIGLYSAADMADASVAKWTGAQPSGVGDIKYEDYDNNGVIDARDIQKIGTPQPKFTYGFVNSFSYKDIDLNIVMQGVYGGNIANAVVRYSNAFVGGDNPLVYALDRWRSESDPGNGMIPKAKAWPNNANPGPIAQFNTWNLFDASYLRINNVTLGYNLTKLIFKGKAQQTARLYFTVMNLYTFSKYPGYNPDVNIYGNNNTDARLGVDQGAYPLPRTFVIGANIGL